MAAPEGWIAASLGDVCSLEYGKSLSASVRRPGPVPVYGSNGAVGRHCEALVAGPGIVVGRKGSIGEVVWASDDFWPIDTTYYVSAAAGVDLVWLYQLLRTIDLRSLNSATGVPGLNRNDAYLLAVSLPPLPEQRKIAAILSSVDEIIEKTEAVIAQLQVVKKAMMQELLTRGMPGRHTHFKQTEIGEIPEGWEVRRLEEVAEGPVNGRSPLARSTPPGVPTFSIAAVRNGRVDIANNLKYADVSPAAVSRFVLYDGDLLIVRGNGNPDLVGKCGVVLHPPAGCIYPDILMRVRLHPCLLRTFFVETWNSDVVHTQIMDRAKTTNGTYKINGSDVRSIRVPLPPLEEQGLIGDALTSVDEAQLAHEAELASLVRTKAELSSALLSGDLRVAPDPSEQPAQPA
ncbi:MAG: restriction endonuclease subunit S [Sandaracinaceae bacterium]|nr:restriction endonuclease subunit S [Myxococcales bacterium]MCB9660734.1 restriction endonuclease subunit S [Sandaracinaceae bacterium]